MPTVLFRVAGISIEPSSGKMIDMIEAFLSSSPEEDLKEHAKKDVLCTTNLNEIKAKLLLQDREPSVWPVFDFRSLTPKTLPNHRSLVL
jgi:hypothetical protein